MSDEPTPAAASVAALLKRSGGDTELQVGFDALCATHGVWMLPDHEAVHLHGWFVANRPIPRSRYLELARSWEQFDRAFDRAPASLAGVARARLAGFFQALGLAGDIGDDHLFVIALGAQDVVFSAGDEWALFARSLPCPAGDDVRFRERLRRGLHPRGQSPAPGR